MTGPARIGASCEGGIRVRESRYFKIVYYLLDKGAATAFEMAEKFEVSVRTIYRDIDALSKAGIPVYAAPGRNGGIYLMSDFVLDKTVLSEEEKHDILTAMQSLSATRYIDNDETLDKLAALFHTGYTSWLEVDFSRWNSENSDNEKFELLKSAVIQRRCVKITYVGSDQTVGERVIQPIKLLYKSGAWYVKAYCRKRQAYRIFKLSRILLLSVLEEGFPADSFPEQREDAGQGYHEIKLRFPKEMAYRVYDEFDVTRVKRQENGDLIVSERMPEDAWLTGFLLSFGTQVDILEPVSLKSEIARQVRLMYEKNKNV